MASNDTSHFVVKIASALWGLVVGEEQSGSQEEQSDSQEEQSGSQEEQSGSFRGESPEVGYNKMEMELAPCVDMLENDWDVCHGSDEIEEQQRLDLQEKLDVFEQQYINQSAVVCTLGKEKNDLSQELAMRDQRMIALQDEASVTVFRNRQLVSEISKLKQSKSDVPFDVKHLQEHVKFQSRTVSKLRKENESLKDEREKLKEDFESARESMTELRNVKEELMMKIGYLEHELATTKAEAFQSEQKTEHYVQRLGDENRPFSSCDNPTCKEHSLQKEIEVMRHNIARLEQERNEAIEKMTVVTVEAEIFKSDFEEERRDRTRAHGELEVLRIKGGQTKAYRKQVSALQIDIDKTRRERNQMKTKLATVEAKSKTESYDLKKKNFKSKTEIENLTRERDSYREQCAKKKEIQADLTKSKNVVEKCRKSIEVLTHKTRVLKEEKKFLSEEIKGLDEQLEIALTSTIDMAEKLEKCKKELKVAKEKAKNTNKKVKNAIYSSPVSTASTESKPSTTETLYQVELHSNQSLRSEIDMLKDNLATTKSINEMLKGLITIRDPRTAALRDAQKLMVPNTVSNPVGNEDTSYEILSLPSNTTDDQPLSGPDPPTCHVMSHGTQDRDPNFHANPRCVSSTKKVASGMEPIAAQNRGKTSDDQTPPLTTSDHPQHLLGKNSSEAASAYSSPPAPQPSHLPSTVSRSLARQSSVESRPPLEPGSEHNGNHYGGSQGNELLQGPPRRQGEAIHQEPLRAGGDPHPIPHHDCARRIASYHDMIGPQSRREGPSQDGAQRRANSQEMLGQRAKRHGDRDKYPQPLRAGGNDVLLSCQNRDRMLLPSSQEPAASVVMNSLRVHEIRSGEGQMKKLPLRAGGDDGSRLSPVNQWGMPNNSTQETYQRASGRLDQQKREDSEGAKAIKMYALEKERNAEVGIPTLHDSEHQSEPQAVIISTGSGPHAQNDLYSESLDQTSKLPKEEMSDLAERNSNRNMLDCSIDRVIENMVEGVTDQVSENRSDMKTMELKPFDPNLSCPICGKVHRIGEIQKFRRHVDMCGNT